MKYAFFIDLDRTLIHEKNVPQKNRDMIAKARENGHLVFLNTGRGYGFIPPFVFEQTSFDGVVAGSGMYCSFGNEVLLSEGIPEELLYEAADFFIGEQRPFYLEGEKLLLYYGGEREGFTEFFSANELKTEYHGEKIQKICIRGVLDGREKEFLFDRFETVCHPEYSECAKKGIGKGTGIKTVLDRIGSGYTSVSIGDSENDVDSFNSSDISVAVDNAPDEIKEMCGLIVASNADGGVGEAIEIIAFGKGKKAGKIPASKGITE